MRKTIIGACVVVLGLGAGLRARAQTPGAGMSDPARVARGKYLVEAGGCGDCHSPKKFVNGHPTEDMTRWLSGFPEGTKLPAPPKPSGPWIASATGDLTAWSGPWGISYAINITPDENTGIGSWSEATFVAALKTGKHMGVSRPILPPMPWPAISKLTDADLKAMYAFLRTIPAVKNRVPEPQPPAGPPPAPAK